MTFRAVTFLLVLFASFQLQAQTGKDWAKVAIEDLAHIDWTYDVLKEYLLFRPDAQSVPAAKVAALMLFTGAGGFEGWVHDKAPRSGDIRMTGPYVDLSAVPSMADGKPADAAQVATFAATAGVGYMTHSRVRLYYSPGVVSWLEGGRKGAIPDGEMIVKQMYFDNPASPSVPPTQIAGWAVMFKDSRVTKDGWLWFLYFLPGNPTFGVPFVAAQYGLSFCLSCHAGTEHDPGQINQMTFADISNIEGKGEQYTYVGPSPSIIATSDKKAFYAGHGTLDINSANDLKASLAALKAVKVKDPKLIKAIEEMVATLAATKAGGPSVFTLPLAAPNPATVALYGTSGGKSSFKNFPGSLFADHVVPGPDGPAQFEASDSCRGCHDISALLGGRDPAMLATDPATAKQYNLSPYGEWSASIMGLAGRDPIFHAQLESERAMRPEIADNISNLCLSCHQVMGQRQFHLDNKGSDKLFTSKYTYVSPSSTFLAPENQSPARWGGLARDGVSCLVCHQVTPEGLGDSSTFTGKFNVAAPGSVFGPFADADIKPYYMEQALGIKPKQGAQITSSALCGSCHTIVLPILPRHGATPKDFKNPPLGTAHEQTTYLEWLNSDYNDERPDNPLGRSCADCHMPATFETNPKQPLEFTIANVEDENFPPVPNRAEGSLITPVPKKGYRRHTLVALNGVAQNMFQQFATELGVTNTNPGTVLTAVPRLQLAAEETIRMGRDQTVRLAVGKPETVDGNLEVAVQIENLAGHKFPSGVGFRRAFIRFGAFDAGGSVLWQSGSTDAAGVILGPDAKPLPSEFAQTCDKIQPDYKVVSSESQVQIFSERVANNEGKLTTSFLGIKTHCKDNRMLPLGWKPNGPNAKITAPYAKGGKQILNPKNPGGKIVSYRMPLAQVANAVRFEATLVYQSIPPFYLKDRFGADGTSGKGPSRERLKYMVNHLNLAETPFRGWGFDVVTAASAR